MIHNIILFAGASVIVFALTLVVRAIAIQVSDRTVAPKPDPFYPAKDHTHEWRSITEFARQCRSRTCGKVEYSYEDNIPDGLREYVDLMTTRQARIDPIGEAGHYPELDPKAWGMKCPWCGRVIPNPDDLPRPAWTTHQVYPVCPFCQNRLVIITDGKNTRYERDHYIFNSLREKEPRHDV